MTREVDPLLERINRTLDECDARSLPTLDVEPKPPPADPGVWPEPVMVEPRPEQMRGWLAGWFERFNRGRR